MVIVGGMGSIWGVLFGTVFLSTLPNVLHFFDEYKDIFYGLILVMILIFLPEGVVVALREKWRTKRLVPTEQAPRTEGEELTIEPAPSGAWQRADQRIDTSADPVLRVQKVTMSFGG